MAEEKSNGLNMKTIIILMIAMIIITGIFSYVFMSIMNNNSDEGQTAKSEESSNIGPTYTLGDFVVNLSGSGGYQFIKANIVVEVDKKEVINELDRRNPQIRDLILLTLREQKIEDIEEPGAEVIKNQVMVRVNEVLNSGQIVNVWFTQLVVQ